MRSIFNLKRWLGLALMAGIVEIVAMMFYNHLDKPVKGVNIFMIGIGAVAIASSLAADSHGGKGKAKVTTVIFALSLVFAWLGGLIFATAMKLLDSVI